MTPDEARYYRASRAARAAWQATQPQLTLTGLDDGPLTAGGETPYSPSGPTLSGTRTGAIIEPGQKETK